MVLSTQKSQSTLVRMASNYADDQDIRFSDRHELTDVMRAGCRAATRDQMTGGKGVYDLGFDRPVTVVLGDYIRGQVAQAIGLIAYRDEYLDALFFVFKNTHGDLMAVMGGAKNISSAIDGWLEFKRYFDLAWDRDAGKCRDVFAVADFPVIWTDCDGKIAGADIEGCVVSVAKTHMYTSYDRVPDAILLRIHAAATAYWADKRVQGVVNAH